MGLQHFDEFNSSRTIQSLSCFMMQTKELDTKLLALDPFDRAEINRQHRSPIGERDTHAHLTATENRSIAQHEAPHHREVGEKTFADKWSSAEDDRTN